MNEVRLRHELSVWADFNDLDGDGRVTTSLRFADSPQRPFRGDLVRLYDDDGNSVSGIVEGVHGLALRVRPLMETWTTAVIEFNTWFENLAPFHAQAQDPHELVPK